MLRDETQLQDFEGNPEPCLAGTMCLMTCFRDHPCLCLAQKIVHNLLTLAHQECFSDDFAKPANGSPQEVAHKAPLIDRLEKEN